MLANVLPGLREIRAPLVSGYLWLVFLFLLLHSDLPSRGEPGAAPFDPLFDLADGLSALGLVTVASVAAYLVGSAMQEVLKLAGRLAYPRSPLYGEVGSKTTRGGREALRRATKSRVDGTTRRLLEIARSPGEKGINREPAAREVLGELPVVRTLLLGEHPELVGELDRLQAEADLRITVAAPLAVLSAYLALNASPGWLLLVPAALLLWQGGQRQREAGDFMVRILRTGRADAPTVTSFELSVTAALERSELEWKLKGEMADGDGMAAFRYGNLLSSGGEPQKAVEPLTLAAEQGVLRAYAELGIVRERLEEYEKAERAYKDGTERGDGEARQLLARLLQGQRRSEEALAEAKPDDQELTTDTMDLEVPGERARLSDYRRRAAAGDSKAALNLGMLLQRRGDLREAAEAFERGIEIDPGDPKIWLRLGGARQRLYLFPEAQVATERALALQRESLGPGHLDVAFTLSRLGTILSELGQDGRALEAKQEALEIIEREVGSDSIDAMFLLGNVGNSLAELGRYEESLGVQERSLEFKERRLGSDHLEVGLTAGNVGDLRFDMGEYQEAAELLTRALRIVEGSSDSNELTAAIARGNLGNVRLMLGEHADALELQEGSLRVKEQTLGPDALGVAEGRVDLAAALVRFTRYSEALENVERSLSAQRALNVSPHRIGEALAVKAAVLAGFDRDEEALALQGEAAAILGEAFGPEHIKVGAVLTEQGETLRRLGRLEEAEEKAQAAIGIWEAFGSGEGVGLAAALACLAAVQAAKILWLEAGTTIRRAIALEEDALGSFHPDLIAMFDLQAEAAAAVGEQEAAERATTRAQSIRAVGGGGAA